VKKSCRRGNENKKLLTTKKVKRKMIKIISILTSLVGVYTGTKILQDSNMDVTILEKITGDSEK